MFSENTRSWALAFKHAVNLMGWSYLFWLLFTQGTVRLWLTVVALLAVQFISLALIRRWRS